MTRSVLFSLFIAALTVGCTAVGDDSEKGESDLSADPMAKIREAVKDVDQEHVVFADDVVAPEENPSNGAQNELTSLYGVDWFQKWGGGRSADHDWSIGTPYGKRCMWASVARFEAVMKTPPAELQDFLAHSEGWRGSFYNWNDDYSGKDAEDRPAATDAKRARLWAWRTTLTKWISQTAKDGSCYLPTRKMLVSYVAACKEWAASNNGQIEGCAVNGENGP